MTNAAPAIPAPVPAVPAAAPAPAQKTLSYALFKESEVLVCTEVTGTDEKVAAFKQPEGFTLLKQTCDSLGRTELTSCTQGEFVTKYYAIKYSDKYMAGCVKGGGQWATNKSLEAQMARAEQDLAASKAAAGIP